MDLFSEALSVFWSLFQLFWPIWVPALVIVLVKLALAIRKKARLAKSGIAELDKLGGEDFEKYLEILFRKLGYHVTRTPYQGDYGADLVIQKDRVQTVVQAKRYNRSVGVKAIQEAVAAQEYYKCDSALVVTNNYYSEQAKKLAAANKVELWDRNQLVDRLLAMKPRSTPVASPIAERADQLLPVAPTPQPAETVAVCATCGKAISPKVVDYCLDHAARFGGQVYCYEHQKAARPVKVKAVAP